MAEREEGEEWGGDPYYGDDPLIRSHRTFRLKLDLKTSRHLYK